MNVFNNAEPASALSELGFSDDVRDLWIFSSRGVSIGGDIRSLSELRAIEYEEAFEDAKMSVATLMDYLKYYRSSGDIITDLFILKANPYYKEWEEQIENELGDL